MGRIWYNRDSFQAKGAASAVGNLIQWNDFVPEPDLDGMDREGLEACLSRVEAELERMDQQEPEDMESEAYEDWADRHEELEDLLDELMDRLDM